MCTYSITLWFKMTNKLTANVYNYLQTCFNYFLFIFIHINS